MLSFNLPGPFPSKKNAWRRGAGRKAYLPVQVQSDIDALLILAKNVRQHLPAGLHTEVFASRVRITVDFYLDHPERADSDNLYTTLVDVLQKAGIIENDRRVRGFAVEVYETHTRGVERADITVEVWK